MAALPSINSSTLEGAILELITYAQVLERDTATNPEGANRITGTANFDTGLFNSTINLEIQSSIDGSGRSVTEVVEYLETPAAPAP